MKAPGHCRKSPPGREYGYSLGRFMEGAASLGAEVKTLIGLRP